MTNEAINNALYEKMLAEQEKYRGWLLSQPPEEILKHTCEYTVREDILAALEDHNLTDSQARAMLGLEAPLADVYKDWQKKETGYMDDIWDTIESRARDTLKQKRQKSQKER